MHPSVRRWLLRTAVVVGAAASIATPQKKWSIEATLPAGVNDATRSRVLVVSASREPRLYVRHDEVWTISQSKESPTAWPATLTFEVPAGSTVGGISVEKGCGGGMCSGECEPPDGEYVRVDRVDLTSWTLASGESSFTRAMGKPGPRQRIEVEASREPTLEVTAPGMTYRPQIESRGSANGRATFVVDFASYRGTGEVKTVWTVRASIGGPCTGPCPVPAGEYVFIAGVFDE